MSADADVLVVGYGIAGASVAHAAMRAGRQVTVVDEGLHRASDLPIALINPLRGHAGRLVPRGVEGMAATFDLIDRLRADGHAIAANRGLHRPLVDLAGEMRAEGYWRTRIADRLAFDFFAASPSGLGLTGDHPALYLPGAGWVAAPDLLGALRADGRARSGIVSIAARVESVARDAVRLADGTVLRARVVLWCGGAWGAHGLDRASASDRDLSKSTTLHEPAIYKPGSLAVTSARMTDAPMTFGLYAAPLGDGGRTLVGPTREDATATFPLEPDDHDAIARLQDRVRRLFGATIVLASAWRGVRLARMSGRAREALGDVTALTTLGSRGFLMAPLLANEAVASL